MNTSHIEFVSEPIIIESGSVSPVDLSRGAPGCPSCFSWRGEIHNVIALLEEGKQLRAYDSSEKYVKSHSFRVHTDTNWEMVLRCDRQVRGNPWRVFTVRRLDG